MKKTLARVCLAASLVVLAAPSFAGNDRDKGHHEKRGGGNSVPEINAAGATLAFALLGGIIAISLERRKKQ